MQLSLPGAIWCLSKHFCQVFPARASRIQHPDVVACLRQTEGARLQSFSGLDGSEVCKCSDCGTLTSCFCDAQKLRVRHKHLQLAIGLEKGAVIVDSILGTNHDALFAVESNFNLASKFLQLPEGDTLMHTFIC